MKKSEATLSPVRRLLKDKGIPFTKREARIFTPADYESTYIKPRLLLDVFLYALARLLLVAAIAGAIFD